MRRMSAQSMQEARQLEHEQLVQQLSNWSIKDGPSPMSQDSAQPLPSSPGQATAATPCMIHSHVHVPHRQYNKITILQTGEALLM